MEHRMIDGGKDLCQFTSKMMLAFSFTLLFVSLCFHDDIAQV